MIPTTGITPNQPLDTITKTDTDTPDEGHSPNPTDIETVMTPTEAIPGHIIETVDATIGVLHNAIFTKTHHTKGHPLIGILLLTLKVAS